MGVVVDPCSDGVAALEVDAVQDGVSGYEGLHGVHVEAHVVLVRVIKARVEARVKFDGDEAGGGGEAKGAGEGEGGVGGEEEGEAVAGGGGVEVVDGEGEGGGEGGVEEGDRLAVDKCTGAGGGGGVGESYDAVVSERGITEEGDVVESERREVEAHVVCYCHLPQ